MKKIVSALTFAAISILMFSCIADKEFDNPAPGTNKDAQLVLRLKTPQGYSPAKSRSLTYADENTINDIWVLVFDKNNTLTAIKKGENVTSSEGSANPSYSGEGSFTVTLSPSGTTADTYNLVVLANAQTIISNTIGLDVTAVSNKSYASVMADISAAITGPMYPTTGGTIPMWGESGQLVIQPGSNNQTLQLTRSVARIDVGVGKATKDPDDAWSWDGKDASSATIPFRLGHVYVIKPNNRYAVAPDKTKLAGEPTVPAGTLPFPYAASESNFGFAATASATGGYTSRDIYVPEADIEMGSPASSGDAHHTDRMAIVVGGYYDGSTTETFYRLDFAVGGSLVNVLRNHLYQFNISKVSGNGFPDVETAYNSLSMNMTVDIYEWDETDMGLIVFDGQNYLSVSQSEFNFTREAIDAEQEDNVLYIKTDVPGGWSIEEIVYPDDEDDEWIALSSYSGDAHEKSEVVLAVTENDTQQPRSAIIWIAAGRLRYQVTVTQTLAPALVIRLTDENGKPVTELVFVNEAPISSQILNVNWQPEEADLAVVKTAVGALAQFEGTGIPDAGIITGGTGFKQYTITPTAFIPDANDPFLEKVSKVHFTTTDGMNYVNKSVLLRQVNYNLLTDVAEVYLLDSQEETIHVRANFGWEITDVSDLDNILSGESALVGATGGYNTTTGDEVRFTMAAATLTGSKASKTATITFKSLVDNTTREVTITATDPQPLCVGTFGGELKEIGTTGVWRFERVLYVQGKDGSTAIAWSNYTGSGMQQANNAAKYIDGRTNTYDLHHNNYDNPAASLCYNKNDGPISDKDDLVWFLPAQKQLMAVWVVHESFDSANKLSPTYYWSATEQSSANSWYVKFDNGITNHYSKTPKTFPVRCVGD